MPASNVRRYFRIAFALGLSFALARVAQAQAVAPSGAATVGALAEQLGKFAIVVAFIESAMSAVFNWRVYRAVVNVRAMKTPILWAVGLAIVVTYHYDIFNLIMESVQPGSASSQGSWLTYAVSALMIAGGSAGINTLFLRLGIRSPIADEPTRPPLSMTEAWFSVKITRATAVGPVQIAIEEVAGPPVLPLVGSLQERTLGQRLREAFGADTMRFPNYGGWTMKVGQNYRITAIATVQAASGLEAKSKVIYEGGFAPRAIVDLQMVF
ncbi:MAG: hypothetical protein ACOH2H_07770 [Cypionkella sp.]